MTIKIRFRKVKSFSTDENHILWSVFQESYDLSFEDFLKKQQSLDRYAIYLNQEQQIVGYTGIRDHSFVTGNKKYRTIYFGQTIIKSEYRKKNLIQKTVVKLFSQHFLSLRRSKLFIWNDSLSYRPYLIMAKNLKCYYPSANVQHQKEHIEIRDILGEKYYGASYCSKTGTVQKNKTILKEKELTLSNKDLSNPHIQFFISKNPNFVKGHGLITFCPATMNNLLFYLKKKYVKKFAHA